MSPEDWQALTDAVATVFAHETSAANILKRIGFPANRRPTWSGNSEVIWAQVFTELDNGIIDCPQRQLLRAALAVYPFNETFRELGERHGVSGIGPATAAAPPSATGPDEASENTGANAGPGNDEQGSRAASQAQGTDGSQPGTAEPADQPSPEAEQVACHVIVRASSEQERANAAAILRDLGLQPEDVWATGHATSFRVGSANTSTVRALLDPTGMSWVVVPPNANDYLIRELYVSGPDGRRFRLVDAPAQQTVADVAAGVVDQYGPSFTGRSRPTVVDRVLPDGQGRRLPPDSTLHDAGVRDGSSLRLGFEATAGAFSPLDHQDALHRMRNQILEYAKSRPDMKVRGAPPSLPTDYEITFAQRSFGPPVEYGGPPVPVTVHTVQIQLRADFPETPPLVFWNSPIFHPNIWPSYDCDAARNFPHRQGLVCLGALATSYTPALSFAELCQTIIDMAAYRNYTVAQPSGTFDAYGKEEFLDDYYDLAAANWAKRNQAEIKAMGGSPPIRRSGLRKPYSNAIEAVD